MITIINYIPENSLSGVTSVALNYGVIGALGEYNVEKGVFNIGKANGSTPVEDIVVVAPLFLSDKELLTASFGYTASDTIAAGTAVRYIKSGVFAFPTALLSSATTWSSTPAGTYVTVNADGRLTASGAADAGTVNVGKFRGLDAEGNAVIEIF